MFQGKKLIFVTNNRYPFHQGEGSVFVFYFVMFLVAFYFVFKFLFCFYLFVYLFPSLSFKHAVKRAVFEEDIVSGTTRNEGTYFCYLYQFFLLVVSFICCLFVCFKI